MDNMKTLPSVMHSAHSFAKVPRAEIPRSSFDRSFGHKTTFDAGYLVPIFIDEALPGDTYTVNMTAFARLATPLKPIMDNMFMETFFFAVPIRLLWDNWQKFNGEQTNPGDSTDFVIPEMVSPVGGYAAETLHDYFSLPTELDPAETVTHSCLWHRAYNLIYNQWFRDQNLQNSVSISTDDGPDDPADYVLLRRGKRHDYFTSCLPFPQKGDAVSVPLGTSAPVIRSGVNDEWIVRRASDGITYNSMPAGSIGTSVGGDLQDSVSGPTGLQLDPRNTLIADLTGATAATINQLRQAFQVQKLLERDARGGSRYTEIVRAHFGVVSPDARLQRPEYLGGGSTPIVVNPIAQTSSTDATTPQGNLAAMGIVSASGHGFSKSFTEHCVLLGLVSVRADLTYQRGLHRMFSRSTRFDFYWPALAHIGEQAVLSKEIFCDGTVDDDDVFGYQERFAEYRYKPSMITGKFRSTDAQSLDIWHLSQDFATRPLLNAAFIQETPPVDRVIAVPTEPHFLFDSYFRMTCARPMPVFGVPGLIDHF